MRQCLRAALLVVLGLVSTVLFGVVTAIMAAVSLAATALIVPGTGTPDAQDKPLYMGNAVERYVTPFEPDCTRVNCNPTSAEYPASFFPLVIFPGWCEPGRCDTWNTSVSKGVTSLDGLIKGTDDKLVVFGYSQGGAVVSNELRAIANNQTLLDKIERVVLIGNVYNPDGGLFTRLGFLPTIPFLDITFGPKTPVDVFGDAGKITSVGFEYDPVMYAPLYWGNPLGLLNALAAFETVHGYYLTPNENGPTDPIAYGYTPQEIQDIYATGCPGPHCRIDDYNNEYWMLPAKSLPIFDLLMSVVPDGLEPIVRPIVNLLTPVLKVFIDLAYDWSGNPGEQRYLSILPFNPFTNWLKVGFDLVAAVGEGLQNAFGGGTTTMIAPPDDSEINVLSARLGDTEDETVPLSNDAGDDLPEGTEGLHETDPQPLAQKTDPQTLPTNNVLDEKKPVDVKKDDELVDDDVKKDDELVDDDVKKDDELVDDDAIGEPEENSSTDPEDDTTDGNKVTPSITGPTGNNDDADGTKDEQEVESVDVDNETPAAA